MTPPFNQDNIQGLTDQEVMERLAQDGYNELPAVRNRRVAVVDGNQMFSRPGPRLVDAFEFLVGLLNERPEVIPGGFPWSPFR